MNEHLIEDIVIVGGGTAGWMAAAALSRFMNNGVTRIHLVESDEIGTVGVGEATIPPIINFNRMLGLDDDEFLRETQGTYKLGIEFVNWGGLGERYFHPFGEHGEDLSGIHFHQLYLRERKRRVLPDISAWSMSSVAASMGKFARPPADARFPLNQLYYAFHFDASLYAKYLRRYAERGGVRRIEGKIVDVALDGETGHVDHVVMEDGRTVGGDLFVDCSGMRALLIGQALGVGYEDWNHWLLNDRALAVPCERVEPLTPYTRVTARDHGWQWRIPLQHRTGNGHVYSSDHISDDEAASVLLANLDGKPLADPRPVRFRPGKRRKAWEKNVVAIGLSAGFLEPLESTSIHLIQTGIIKLLGLFPHCGFAAADVAEYNRQHDFEFSDVRDFIVAHYKVTEREGTPYWRYLKNMAVPDSLTERLELFASSGRFYKRAAAELFRVESWVQVLLGQGFAMGHDPNAAIMPADVRASFLDDIRGVVADAAARMPDHAAFIDRYCKAPPVPA